VRRGSDACVPRRSDCEKNDAKIHWYMRAKEDDIVREHRMRMAHALESRDTNMVRRALHKFYDARSGALVRSGQNVIQKSHCKFIIDTCICCVLIGDKYLGEDTFQTLQEMKSLFELDDHELSTVQESMSRLSDARVSSIEEAADVVYTSLSKIGYDKPRIRRGLLMSDVQRLRDSLNEQKNNTRRQEDSNV
jgi:hypothetical protein